MQKKNNLQLMLNQLGLTSSAPVLYPPPHTHNTLTRSAAPGLRSRQIRRREARAAVATLINVTGAAVCRVRCTASRPLEWQLQRDADPVGPSRAQSASRNQSDPRGPGSVRCRGGSATKKGAKRGKSKRTTEALCCVVAARCCAWPPH